MKKKKRKYNCKKCGARKSVTEMKAGGYKCCKCKVFGDYVEMTVGKI